MLEMWYRRRDKNNTHDVKAVQLGQDNAEQVAAWCKGRVVEEIDALDPSQRYVGVNLVGAFGYQRASQGDYVIQDLLGDFHVQRAANFESMWERVG